MTITAEIETTGAIGDIVSKYDWKAGERGYVFGVGGEGDEKSEPGKLFAWFSSEAATFKGVVAYGSQRVDDGQPHHVAMVFEAGQAVRFFVDGIEDEAVRIEGPIPNTVAQSARGLAVGAGFENSSRATAFRFDGRLANVRLYDRMISNPSGLNLSKPEVAEYRRLAKRLTKAGGASIEVPVMDELPEPRETHVLVRGDFKKKGERVFAGVPKIMPTLIPTNGASPSRLDFARWLFSGKQPLTARVAVNRIWQHHFGEGLVRTMADFGHYGDRPTHPELLDWLAVRFAESGWDVKAMHRLIVNSATYRQASQRRADLDRVDPQNRFACAVSACPPACGADSATERWRRRGSCPRGSVGRVFSPCNRPACMRRGVRICRATRISNGKTRLARGNSSFDLHLLETDDAASGDVGF